MIDMDEKKEVVSSKWADRVAIALLICLLIVIIITGLSVYKAYGAEEKPPVNLVLQFETADGGILKGLIGYYLISDCSIKVRDNAEYIIILSTLKKTIWGGLLDGNCDYMFISIIVLDQGRATGDGFTSAHRWEADKDKANLARETAGIIALIISRISRESES